MALKGVPKSPEHRAKLAAVNRGKKASAETRAKMSAASMGRKKSAEHAANISAGRKGIVFGDDTKAKMAAAAKVRAERDPGHLAEAGRMGRASRIYVPHTAEAKRKMSISKLGHGPYWRRDVRVWHNGTRMRSAWEVRVAAALDALGIRWEYEPTRFHFGDQTYSPDFYLPDEGVYWEVKGWFTERAKRAVRLFRERESVPLVVINEAAMLMLERAVNKAA